MVWKSIRRSIRSNDSAGPSTEAPAPETGALKRYATGMFALLALIAPGCALLSPLPRPTTTEQRLANFPADEPAPLYGQVDIYWDDYQIPFIVAEHDNDVPFAMGMIHAHLRMGQIEMLRRVARGQLAEMFGPFAVGLDRSIRVLDLAGAADRIRAELPADTIAWLERYVDGINHFREHAPKQPAEVRMLGVGDRPWTVEDVIVVGRLLSADVNWFVWYQMLQMRDEPGFEKFWERLKEEGRIGEVSFGGEDPMPLPGAVMGATRSGSNAFAVGGERTAGGGAVLGSDPHLGVDLPNFWVLMGYHSPGATAVGMTYPGVPAILVGRNRDIAWGATNMRSLNTTFYDVSTLPEDQITERTERIGVRWWLDRKVRIRETPFGPIINDAPILSRMEGPPIAMRWRGHDPSDELTPFLRLADASNWEQFRSAFATYAVSGQNFIYADRHGNVGQILAVEYDPAAGRAALDGLIADPHNPAHHWGEGIPSHELPAAYNPESGYVITSNNNPVRTDPPIALVASANDRYRRIGQLIERANPVTASDARAIQADVYSAASHQVAHELARRLEAVPQANEGRGAALRQALAEWDGHYRADSRGAVAYQVLINHVARLHYKQRYGRRATSHILGSFMFHDLVWQDLQAGEFDDHLREALRRSLRAFGRHESWGSMHQLRLNHALGQLPLVGNRFRYGEFPTSGSTTTIAKSAHVITDSRHTVRYGAQSRFVTDLSHPNENYFVLLGGQDGWFGSANFKDQWPLWRHNQRIRLPLVPEAAIERSKHHMTLQPQPSEEGDRQAQ